jgi:hypothetical protein
MTSARTPRDLRGLLVAGPLLIAAFLLLNRTEDVVVLFPPEGLIAALPDNTDILGSTRTELILSGAPGLTAALYAAGATIVLNAGRGGCTARALP